MQVPAITAGKIIQLVILCLVVGFVMAVIGIGPDEFWHWIMRLGERALRLVKTILTDGFKYLLMGAAVVLPMYAVMFIMRLIKKK
jgi:hypothetical protein